MRGILFYIAFHYSLLSEKWNSQKNYTAINHANFILFLWMGVCATQSRINSLLTTACETTMPNKAIVASPLTHPWAIHPWQNRVFSGLRWRMYLFVYRISFYTALISIIAEPILHRLWPLFLPPSNAFVAFLTVCHSDNTQKHSLSPPRTVLRLLTTSSWCFPLKETCFPNIPFGVREPGLSHLAES